MPHEDAKLVSGCSRDSAPSQGSSSRADLKGELSIFLPWESFASDCVPTRVSFSSESFSDSDEGLFLDDETDVEPSWLFEVAPPRVPFWFAREEGLHARAIVEAYEDFIFGKYVHIPLSLDWFSLSQYFAKTILRREIVTSCLCWQNYSCSHPPDTVLYIGQGFTPNISVSF